MIKWWKYSWLLLILSCTVDEEANLFVDTDIAPYFERFVEEGSERGHDIDLVAMEIEGMIESLNEEGVLGQCVHDNLNPDRVVIDADFWNKSTDLHREFLVFHELGHCVLGRGHLDTRDAEGKCISIMNAGSATCRSNYTIATRATYLDELFQN